VAFKRRDTTTSTIAAVNSAYAAARYTFNRGFTNGSVTSTTETTYDYKLTPDGPQLIRERTEDQISYFAYLGQLDIGTDGYEGLSPSSIQVVSQETIIEYETVKAFDGRDFTKTATSRWVAYGLTSEGKSAFGQLMNSLRENETIGVTGIVDAAARRFLGLRFQGTEIQTSFGLAPAPVKPDDQSILASENGDTREKFVEGFVSFQGATYDDGDVTNTATYDMPFAPDDIFEFQSGNFVSVPGGARDAAIRFGELEAALDIGHAFGQNIVTSFDKLPSFDLAPVYVRTAGIEAAFLLDAPAYAWDENGLVMSADLMLIGVTGYYGEDPPDNSWVRLPVSTLALQRIDE
jgi:hypothetical protein